MKVVIKVGGGPLEFSKDVWDLLDYNDDGIFETDECSKEFRTHPTFIGIIESLGEKATEPIGCYFLKAKLEIIEVPFDSLDGWYIACDDNKGIEWVEEEHRRWS
jgi:hypothetical protein